MPSAAAAIPYVDSAALISVTTTVKTFYTDYADFGFTQAQIEAADIILISMSGTTSRYRYVDPATTTVGYPVADGETLEIKGKSRISTLSIIAQSGTANTFVTLLTYGIPPV